MRNLLFQERGQLGHFLEQIANESVVGNLEDGCLRILVDGNNDLAVLHAGNMLNGARDTHSDIQLRCNNLACLADLSSTPSALCRQARTATHLHVIGYKARIHRRTRRADARTAKRIRKILQQLEVLAAAETATATDHNAGAFQRRAGGLAQLRALVCRELGKFRLSSVCRANQNSANDRNTYLGAWR